MNTARLIDEMAVTLCGVAELADDLACMRALRRAGFPERAILRHLEEARELARGTRRSETDLWAALRLEVPDDAP